MSIFGLEILGWLLVGLLGGLAAGARYLLDAEISRLVDSPFPFGILVVNLTGSFLLGLLSGTVLHGHAYRRDAITVRGLVAGFDCELQEVQPGRSNLLARAGAH